MAKSKKPVGKTIRVGKESYEATREVPRERARIILAYGEVTGHAHAIASKDAVLYEPSDEAVVALGTRILVALGPVSLSHEEHDTIDIPRGEWGVRIQRQYDAGEFRRVED